MKKNLTPVTLVLIILAGLLVLGGIVYAAMNPQALRTSERAGTHMHADGHEHEGAEHHAHEGEEGHTEITWQLTDAGETDGFSYTNVTVLVNGTTYEAGRYMGSCSEIDERGGIDGTGLLPGELSAVQCWYAGGGDEIGVFAHEDGGYDLLAGELAEGDAENPPFRGSFRILTTILP